MEERAMLTDRRRTNRVFADQEEVIGRVRMKVSSTRQDEPTGFARQFHLFSYSGTNRKTHRMIVV
jgi:hypothetical protein